MLRSRLCNYSDACIVIKGNNAVQRENDSDIDGYNRNLILQNILTAYQESIMYQLTMQKIQIL